MRKPWIAIAVIALVVGLIASYRMGRVGNPRREPALEDRRAEAPSLPEPGLSAPQYPAGPVMSRTLARGDEARSTPQPEHEIAIAPLDAAPSSSVPVRTEGQQRPHAQVDGNKVSASIGPPVPIPTAPTIAPESPAPAPVPVPVPADDPESDRHPPVLLYLRFDPPEIRDGGVATLSVGVSDDLSGVKLVFGTVRSPSEVAIVPFAAQDATGGGVFTARITIPHQAETGEWFVGSLQIVDKADNPLNLVFARATVPRGGELVVSSEESDSTAPDVHRVSIDKGSVRAGEKNQIVVDVDDDRSGVASVMGTFQSPSRSAFIPFACRANGESSWAGEVAIPANADCGEWTLRQLRVTDNANNTAYLTADSPQVGPVSFIVSGGGGCDSEPPVIDALLVSPAVVSNAAASEIALTFSTHDDGSGVGSLSGWVEGPVASNGQVPKIFFACKQDPNHPEEPMIARISVPQFAARGAWRVALAQVMDNARNTRSYNKDDPALAGAGFMVE